MADRKSLIVNRQSLGFTIIELLVVVGIIGLLASTIIVALGNARLKGRDARRLEDMGQIKSGLDIYYSHGSGYAATADFNASQSSGTILACSGESAFKVPQDPKYNADPTFAYVYSHVGTAQSGCGSSIYPNFKVQFKIEGDTSLGPPGTYWLSPRGITATDPFP